MQSISLDEIQPGMLLAKPLILADGTILLHEGTEVKARYINYLRDKGFTSLFVGETAVTVEDVEDCYDSKHKQAAMAAAHEVVNQFRVGKGIQLDRVKMIVSDLIDQLGQKPENMIHLLDLRRKEEYMFSHAVNTCILSVMTGLAMGYDAKQLSELGLAAMLHDIGKIRFSPQLARQFPHYLTKQDKEEYRRHSFYSLEILRENTTLSTEVINACFQHHERWNGSGYPLGLKGAAISEYAQIISIADVYDRLLVGMPHRLPTPIYYAVAILNKAAGEYFNPAIVERFNQNVAVYPMGKTVKLSNQQSGLILGVGIKSKTIPVVRLTAGQDGNDINRIVELDLAKNPDLFILDIEELYSSYAQAYADRAHVYHTKIEQV
ncbi:HD-GYP domain-containing protein [Sporomusa termitida]|uniref:HD domain protein n=1 Tax=Sporomusa termitida TaxID=2377 RepID=A0A517DQ13_9FIRM|nr:HD-GYP domain-containing protein [Sporomusa termitida]QDR79398.1 HD domain protein [Sporomusa termitida]